MGKKENSDAIKVAAFRMGIEPEVVRQAVEEYRNAAVRLADEPEWSAIMHMTGRGFATAQYGADGTRIALQVESSQNRNGEWKEEERFFVFKGVRYEHFSEAKQAELLWRGYDDRDNVVPLPTPGDG